MPVCVTRSTAIEISVQYRGKNVPDLTKFKTVALRHFGSREEQVIITPQIFGKGNSWAAIPELRETGVPQPSN